MPDVWPQVERWNAAREKVKGDALMRALLERHAVWVSEGLDLGFHCDTCMTPWPCIVFAEIEMVL